MHSALVGKTRLASRVAVGAITLIAPFIGTMANAQSKTETGSALAAPLTLPDAAAVFGMRQSVLHASLSPDGRFLAVVQPNGSRGEQVKVLDLTDPNAGPLPIAAVDGNPDRLNWCRWRGVRRLICELYAAVRLDNGDVSYVSRLVAMDADGKRIQTIRLPQRNGQTLGYTLFGGAVLDWNTGEDGHVLMVRRYVPEFSTGTRLVQSEEGLAVDDINSISLGTNTILKARKDAQEYISDGRGRVRIMGYDPEQSDEGYSSSKTRYLYRSKDKDGWENLGDYDSASGEGFNPYHVDPALDVAYGLKKTDGREAAYSLSLDGKATERLILARPDVDVNGFATIGRNRRVVGVTYETDRHEVFYFDADLKRLAASLARALPTMPLIRFADSSQDERKLLVWAGSDNHPGRYYLLDRDARGMSELANSRSGLEELPLATVKPVQIKVADGTLVPGYLTLPPGSGGKNLPAIVMPHGGPSARDSWGFDWLAQFWANRGYAVLQPNFRGSSGYGDAWFQTNGFRSWQVAIGDVTDSGKWLIEQGIADPKKLAVLGWSYGGYAALQSAVTQPDLFRAVVAIAPVADLGRLKDESLLRSNYLVSKDFIGSGAHIEEGSPARQAAKIKAPILMFHGSYDVNVSIRQSELMAERLRSAGKQGQLVTFDKLDHYLDDSIARRDMLIQSATFLEQSFASAK
jgi:dipeptidyl aminopeptidase/acylaminoacyl peptidase